MCKRVQNEAGVPAGGKMIPVVAEGASAPMTDESLIAICLVEESFSMANRHHLEFSATLSLARPETLEQNKLFQEILLNAYRKGQASVAAGGCGGTCGCSGSCKA